MANRNPRRQRRLLMLSPFFAPAATAGVMRSLRFAKYLARDGWKIDVVCIRPQDVQGELPFDEQLAEELPLTVEVHPVRMFRPLEKLVGLRSRALALNSRSAQTTHPTPRTPHRRNHRNKWQRLKDTISDLLRSPDPQVGWVAPAVIESLRLWRRKQHEIIYATAPPFSALSAGMWVSKLTGRPWVADFRDPCARAPWLKFAQLSAHRLNTLARLETRAVRSASAVILNTTRMLEEFTDHYAARGIEARFTVIPNGFDPEHFTSLRRPRRRKNQPMRLLHAGHLYNRRDPRPLLTAMQRLSFHPSDRVDIRLELIGSIDRRFADEPLMRRLQAEGLVTITGWMPAARLRQELLAADVLVLIQPDTKQQVPGKLYEYIAAGRPVLALTEPDGQCAQIVQNDWGGWVCRPDDIDCITAAIAEAADKRAAGRLRVPLARKRAAAFDGRAHVAALEELFEQTIGWHSRATESRGAAR